MVNEKTKKKLKIAHFGQKNCMTTEGGVEVVVSELAIRQVACGHEVTCYNRSAHHVSGAEFDVAKVKEWKGIHMKYVPTIPKKGFAAVTASFFATLACIFGNYDVVHIHAEGPAFFSRMLSFSKIFNKGLRICWTCHGLDWKREKWKGGIGAKFIKLGEQNIVKDADSIIVLSENIQNYFEKTYNRKTYFIPNGITRPRKRKPDLIKKEMYLYGEDYYLYLSRIVPEKRADLLIDAFKQVKTAKKLVISGGSSDSEKHFMELKKRAAGDKRIIFTGFVQGSKKEELYSNAYAYVLPSDLEGMPLCLLEAMSYGNCCVVSDINECMEVVEDKAVTFKTNDVEDLRTKLQELCDNPQKVAGYREQSADFICKKYDWDKIVSQILSLYEGEEY